MLPLAAAAQRAGHEVVIATSGSLVAQVEQHGFKTWQVGGEEYCAPSVEGKNWIPGLPLDVSAKLRAPGLMRLAEAWAPDVVAHEPIDLAGPIIATRIRARHLIHSLGPMLPTPMWAVLSSQVEQVYREWNLPRLMDILADATYLDICPPSLQNKYIKMWKRISPLRPVCFEPAGGETLPASMAALPYADTIHVTMGTVVNKAPSLFEVALAGLRDLAVNIIITVGPDIDPALLGPQPPHIIAERFITHRLLLPRCRLVINHAGNGTVLSTLSYGIPLLLLPQGADQFQTASSCARAGVALVLKSAEITPEAVGQAVRRLLTEPSFSSAARHLQSEIAGMPPPEQVVESSA